MVKIGKFIVCQKEHFLNISKRTPYFCFKHNFGRSYTSLKHRSFILGHPVFVWELNFILVPCWYSCHPSEAFWQLLSVVWSVNLRTSEVTRVTELPRYPPPHYPGITSNTSKYPIIRNSCQARKDIRRRKGGIHEFQNIYFLFCLFCIPSLPFPTQFETS